MGATCTVRTNRNSCKFFSESDQKKWLWLSKKVQVSDPGPSWPSCFLYQANNSRTLAATGSASSNVFRSPFFQSCLSQNCKGLNLSNPDTRRPAVAERNTTSSNQKDLSLPVFRRNIEVLLCSLFLSSLLAGSETFSPQWPFDVCGCVCECLLACGGPCGFTQTITSTVMDGFQNNWHNSSP